MKRILQVVSSLELGGTEAFIMNHYRCLNREEIQFDFLVFYKKEWPHLEEIEKLGGKVFYATMPTFRNLGKFLPRMKRAIQEGGPYVAIHCHAEEGNAVPLLCGMLCGIKKRIAHTHAIDTIHPNPLKRLLTFIRKTVIKLCATDYWACSKDAGESFYGSDFFEKKGKLINNGIPVDQFLEAGRQIENLRAEFGIGDHIRIVLGNISRFDENKNQIFLVKTFQYLLKKHPDALLLLGGTDGGMLEEVKAYVAANKLDDHVRFIGKRNDVAECLKLIDVYIFPSIYEGLGIALLEAQAAGSLCVASTGVPRASDMGFGAVHYLDLLDGEAAWAEFISEKVKNWKGPAQEDIRYAFAKNGYDIKESCKELVNNYE